MDYIGATEPVQVRVGLINAGFLETLGLQPMLGRIISSGEDVQGGPRLAMVSNHFWQNYLGSDPHAVGNTIQLGGKLLYGDRRNAREFCSASGACRRFRFTHSP
jgi:hypothetical protein